MAGGQHVIPTGSRWSIRRAGSSRATRVFDDRGEAIAEARVIARNQGSVLYIHGRDGRIERREPPLDASPR